MRSTILLIHSWLKKDTDKICISLFFFLYYQLQNVWISMTTTTMTWMFFFIYTRLVYRWTNIFTFDELKKRATMSTSLFVYYMSQNRNALYWCRYKTSCLHVRSPTFGHTRKIVAANLSKNNVLLWTICFITKLGKRMREFSLKQKS